MLIYTGDYKTNFWSESSIPSMLCVYETRSNRVDYAQSHLSLRCSTKLHVFNPNLFIESVRVGWSVYQHFNLLHKTFSRSAARSQRNCQNKTK